MRSCVSDDSRRIGRCPEKHLIQVLPSLAAPRDGKAICLRKSPFSDMLSEVVTHAIEWGAADRLPHSEAIQNVHTSGHQSFAAWFLFGKVAALEEFHLHATSSKQNRKRGTRNAPTAN
jgi:hypothetical protein